MAYIPSALLSTSIVQKQLCDRALLTSEWGGGYSGALGPPSSLDFSERDSWRWASTSVGESTRATGEAAE